MCYAPAVSEEWTTLRVLQWTTERFRGAGVDSPRLEAEVLLAHALGCDRVSLYTAFDKPLGPEELAGYRGLIKRRLAGEPSAYLRGGQEFWSLPLAVDARVLVPRPDTETLVQVVLEFARGRDGALRVADVGTGSGAIALALARELPHATVVATDRSEDALAVARANAEALGLAVEFRAGDLLDPLRGATFHALVANLPYIPTGDLAGLPAAVQFEPRAALDGGPDGLDPIRRLVAGAPAIVAPGGLLALEHGFDQADAVAALIRATSAFDEPALTRDLGGRARITGARRTA